MEPRTPAPLWQRWTSADVPIRVGVPARLLGEAPRRDGSRRRNGFLADRLAPFVQLVRTTPEDLWPPRPWTDATAARAQQTDLEQLDGRVSEPGSRSSGAAPGSCPDAPRAARAHLVVEEERRLADPALRSRFVERLFAHNRWRVARRRGLTRRSLVAFHTAHKLQLLAHDEPLYRDLGRWLGSAGTLPDGALFAGYEARFFAALDRPTRVSSHVNVLEHALGHLRGVLGLQERRALRLSLHDYRRGLLPRSTPLALLRFHVEELEVEYLAGQLYLDPHPAQLDLPRGARELARPAIR